MQHPPPDTDPAARHIACDVEELEIADTERDAGATLLELLVVVVILGLLIAAVVVTLTGVKSQAAESTCSADERHLHVAAESYFAAHRTRTIPAVGVDPDRFEHTLVDGGFLRHVSEFHDLDAEGVTITKAGTQC